MNSIEQIAHDQNPWWRDPGQRASPLLRNPRAILPLLLDRARDPRIRRATLLLGPRRVGKTTVLRQLIDALVESGWPPASITYFDFDDDRLGPDVEPAEVARIAPPGADPICPRILVLDEVTRAKNWPRWLKRAVDEDSRRSEPRFRIVATDSLMAKLRQGGFESGGARWEEFHMEGLSFAEFVGLHAVPGESHDATFARRPEMLRLYLANGGFPEHVHAEDFAELRRRLREDVIDKAIGRDLRGTRIDTLRSSRLFAYLAQASGDVLNLDDRANDTGTHPRTLATHVDTLLDTGLIVALYQTLRQRGARRAKASAQLRPRPRLFAFDHGLILSLTATPDPDRDGDVRRRVVQAVVFRHLRELAGTERRLSHAQDSRQGPMVFVAESLAGRAEFVVDTLATGRVDSERIETVDRLRERTGAPHGTIVYDGYERTTVGALRLLPLLDFLRNPGQVAQGGPA